MSLLSKKHPANDIAGVRDRAVDTAKRVVPAAKSAIPAAKQAVPMAKNAGSAVRRSAEDAAAWAKPVVEDAKSAVEDARSWAAPRIEDARSWAAPRLERSGVAVQETIAPAISEAMVSAARRLDVKPARRRRWPRVLAVGLLIAAVASAAAAVAMRRRPADIGYMPVDVSPDEMSVPPVTPVDEHLADGSAPDTEVNNKLHEA